MYIKSHTKLIIIKNNNNKKTISRIMGEKNS